MEGDAVTNRRPLEGIRVCDFCWVWAGPTCTGFLTSLGAEVIKIETWLRMDSSRSTVRRYGTEPSPPNQSLPYNTLNPGKQAITLNARHPRGNDLVKELVKVSDVVTNNFAAGVMDRIGLGYEALKEIRPDIIMLSMSGFGATGPLQGYHGYQPTFEALSGLSDISGYPGGAPIRSGAGAHIDIVNGMAAASAVMMALNYRLETGEGQFIDLSEWEVPCALLGEEFVGYSMNHRNPTRRANRDDVMAPHNCYPCQGEDKWISIAIATEEEWQALCGAMGNPEWTRQREFSDAFSRWKNQEELDKLIGEWTKQYTHCEVMDMLQKVGVAAIPSFSEAELLADPHTKERDCWVELEHPEAGKALIFSTPWKLSETPAGITRHAPLVGEHNERVFLELLGMPVEEFAELIGEQVLY